MKRKILMTFAVFAGICGAALPARTAGHDGPHFARIEVAEFTINPRSIANSTPASNRDALLRRLADEATNQAIRTLRARSVADDVEPASSDSTNVPVLGGHVEMLVDLPPDVGGVDASRRRGAFAVATAQIKMPDGSIVHGGQISLPWSAVWWADGGRSQHLVPREQVLAGFARKAADHSVRELLAHQHSL